MVQVMDMLVEQGRVFAGETKRTVGLMLTVLFGCAQTSQVRERIPLSIVNLCEKISDCQAGYVQFRDKIVKCWG
ncbi:MAG: hypothetical protein ACOX3A_05465 [bacterium]